MKEFCQGFLTTGVSAGLKAGNKKDLGLIYSIVPAAAAGVFTKNIVKAAPVVLDMERIRSGYCQAIIINSKNANCCTGAEGIKGAFAATECLASNLNIDEEFVLISSTGVIGQPYPIEKIKAAIPSLVKNLSRSDGMELAEAIMTTDTKPKLATLSIEVEGEAAGGTFTISGVAKGSGMIHPDMATMLCFVCTDIKAEPKQLQDILNTALSHSFHRITIDGDTSTNDTLILLANGASGLSVEEPSVKEAFQKSLKDILLNLAKMIVKDGEGATKLIKMKVIGAASREDAKKIADVIASSPLVKTALFGEDANWGRILAAAGRAGVVFNPQKIKLFFDDVMIMKNSEPCSAEEEARAAEILKKDEILILLDIDTGGTGSASVYTCDLSVGYVKINADYRT